MRYERTSAKGITRLRVAALVVVLSFGVVLPSAGALAGPSPRFLPVASGRFLGRTWSLGIEKANDRRCYELSLGGRIGGGDSVCESNRQFNEPWSRRLGESDLNNSASVELDITSPQVRRLELLLGHPPATPRSPHRKPTWLNVATREITGAQAAKAHVNKAFRFAIVAGAGNLCVEKVRAFDSSGRLLENITVPCED